MNFWVFNIFIDYIFFFDDVKRNWNILRDLKNFGSIGKYGKRDIGCIMGY